MRIICCSSGCCGVKHIRDFPSRPSDGLPISLSDGYDDDGGTSNPPTTRWEIVTEEDRKTLNTAEDYFRFLIAQLQRRRPHGLVTLNIASEINGDYCCEDCDGPYEEWLEGYGEADFDTEQVDAWRPIFKELGFSERTFINSNTCNQIHHFELAY